MPRGALKVNMELELAAKNRWIVTKVTESVKQLDKSVKKAGKTADSAAKGGFASLAGAYNALIVAGRMKNMFVAAMRPAVEMEEAMTRLSVATGVTGEAQRKLADAARAAAAATPFDPAQALDAMRTVHLATNDVESSVNTLIPVLQLASTYLGGNVAQAANIAGDLIRGFGLNARDSALSLDMLAKAARFTRTQVADLAPGIRKFAIAGGIAGTTYSDVLQIFTLANASFRNAEANMTGLLRVVQRLSKETIAAPLREYLGVAVVDQATGKMRPLIQILRDMAMAAKANEGQWAKFIDIMSTAAEARAVKPLIAATNSLRQMSKDGKTVDEVLKSFNSTLVDSEGFLAGMSEEAMKPLGKQIEILHDNIFKLLENAFSPMLWILTPVVTGLRGYAEAVSWLLQDIPIFSDVLRVLVGGFTAFVVTAGIAKGVSMAFKAVQDITAMANAWLTRETRQLTEAQLAEAQSATMAAQCNTRLGRALIGLRGISASVRVAFKSMWNAIKGPFVWIMLAVEAITWGIGKLMGTAKTKSEDIAKKQQSALLKQMQVAGSAFGKQSQGVDKLNKSISSFEEAVKNWKDTIKSQLPTLPKKGLTGLEAGVERAIKAYGLTPEAAGKLRYELQTVQQVFAAGGRTTLEELNQAQASMRLLGEGLKGMFPESESLAKSIEGVTKGIANFRENSGDMATVLMWLNAGSSDYKNALLAAMKGTEAHVEKLKAEGKLNNNRLQEWKVWREKAGKMALSPKELTPEGVEELRKLQDWIRMLGDQTAEGAKLKREMDAFMQIQFATREEILARIGKGKLSPKEQKNEAAYGGLHKIGTAAPASVTPGAGAGTVGGGGMAAAKSSPNQNIASTAANTAEIVKQLKQLNRRVQGKGKSVPEPEQNGVRDKGAKEFVRSNKMAAL